MLTEPNLKAVKCMTIPMAAQYKQSILEKENSYERQKECIYKAFVKENLKTKDGETFHAVTLPKGVIIDGVDRGLYRFTTKYIYDDKFNDNNRLFSFPADYEMKLTLSQKTEAGKWEQADSITVTAEKLKEAVLQERKEYMESHKGKEQEEGQAENSDFEENDLPFDEEPEL